MSSGAAATSRPSTCMRPAVGTTNPSSALIIVLLPAPFGPSSPTAPFANDAVTSRSATLLPYATVTLARATMEPGHFVAREQRLLQEPVARHAAVVGVREDRADHPLRILLLAQDLAAAKRMILEAGPPLVIEIVQQRDDAPALLVLAELPRVAAHGGFHGHRVLQEALVLRVLGQQLPRGVAVRRKRHGKVVPS